LHPPLPPLPAPDPGLDPHPGAHTVFLATDSEVVLRDARTLFPKFTFLYAPNMSRTGLTSAAPTVILDEVLKKRARTGVDIASTQRDALLGAVDALLLARCDVLVGKFTSGLFRAAYALAAARKGGLLPPFVSLDAPWCADYGIPRGYNDNFPRRPSSHPAHFHADLGYEQISPEEPGRGGGIRHNENNAFLC